MAGYAGSIWEYLGLRYLLLVSADIGRDSNRDVTGDEDHDQFALHLAINTLPDM